jgi:hypothetical protein
MKITLRLVPPEEEAEGQAAYDAWYAEQLIADAWHRLEVQLCEDERRGHNWHLDLDPFEGCATLRCLHCPADIDDLCPDGHDLMVGEFEVYPARGADPGYVLSLNFGSVWVNGEDRQGFTYGWRGPVTASVRVEKYGGYWEPAEYDVWVDVDPL